MRNIDFLVIGTQKGGTKSIYFILRAHPEIFIPHDYEVAFFALDDRYRKGLDWYFHEFFADAERETRWGEVSPQYMSASASAERIHQHFPGVKLIASLRNPIDRAYSAYRMMVRRTLETRPFDSVIDELEADLRFRPDLLKIPLLDDFEYLRTGFYGQILQNYLQFFPREQIHLEFTERWSNIMDRAASNIYRFLDVTTNIEPADYRIEARHTGGVAAYPGLNALLEHPAYRRLVQMLKPLVPKHMRGLTFRIQEWNTKPGGSPNLSAAQRSRLAEIYRADVAMLEHLFDIETPWPDFKKAGQ